ncbi:Putative alpha/Beta hydrolase [Colletotrichum destructivum]|uniref:Alpha/Beta hydrolase n=1 Tax=Colletotrichum destructivum TaxID=34406 RepID=A0AAX4J5D8_9PEZI|nr:Putative alpha/Beta hydrolase [Colletotrichum destructivum]
MSTSAVNSTIHSCTFFLRSDLNSFGYFEDNMSASQDESRDNFASKLARKLWRRDVADPNPPALTRVYAPPEGPVCMDIVFVHGLGGTSRGTWTGGSYFWPGSLDKNDPLQMARVWTFGYGADFKKVFKKSAAGIYDFALELLCQLRDNDEICGSEPSLPLQKIRSRRIPLVFVAHSMGGLVIKEVTSTTPYSSTPLIRHPAS